MFATRIGGVDSFRVVEVIGAIDTIDEDDAGLSESICRAHDFIPKFARGQTLVTGSLKFQFPGSIGLHCGHEVICD